MRIVKNIYEKVKCCVRSCTNYSVFRVCRRIKARGGNFANSVFIICWRLRSFFQNDVISGHSFDDILLLLLFADAMVILGKSVDEINTSLELLCNYCNTWSLEVNAHKTKDMVFFGKRGGLLNNEYLHIMATCWKK